ncbi:MAG: methyltransferase domain-containing protein [Alphaproteobacteria bacterium]|jgi:spore coat polysaccharide biosynthesis protein SpsF|nr:methyltransferase domain-containing protein [Alphaproteobacteria bacterium]MDP6781769.1 methyltransferase domain-containing protein [Alphaproteobacteria bacterium]|tara:strand:+ start:1081 stop:1710 length:630 start_codon:yes stop_codon:yes gene_type:complete
MTDGNAPIDAWKGEFGDDYAARNRATKETVGNAARAFGEILCHVKDSPPASILEVGANIGINLRALSSLTDAALYAVEPNAHALEQLVADKVVPPERLFDAVATKLPLDDGTVDLVFTSGVLIHVPPADLEAAYGEIHRVAACYILCIEYFSPTPVEIPYRGHEGLLFKRDFGGMWLDLFPALDPIANGFFWRQTTGLDDINWWLFRKP